EASTEQARDAPDDGGRHRYELPGPVLPQPSTTAFAEAFAPDNPCGVTLLYPARHVQTALRHAAGHSGGLPRAAARVGEGVGEAWALGRALPGGRRQKAVCFAYPWKYATASPLALQVPGRPADPVVPDAVALGRPALQHLLEMGQGIQRRAVGHFVNQLLR